MNSKRSKIESSETPAVDRHTTADDDKGSGMVRPPLPSRDATSESFSRPSQFDELHEKDDKQEAVWVEVINCETSSPLRIAYSNVKSIGSGSFGVVYSATLGDNREVAIKKVLQDKRYKNRELQMLRLLHHTNIVSLYYYFYSTSSSKPGETYLNLIQEYVPQTLSRLIRHYWRIRQSIPLVCVKLYSFQLLRGLAYMHNQGICHRDIKPQNLLINPDEGVLKICDFGSAKALNPEEPNVSYICSRYYRAPELIFGATHYTVQIDMWSAGCVIGELLLGRPLFPGESGVDQLVEIIKVLGTPTREQVLEMNPHYSEFKFPNIQGCSWEKIIRNRSADTAFCVLEKLLVYSPKTRMTASDILGCSFFSDLISPPPGHPADATGHLPSGKPAPSFINQFTEEELSYFPKEMSTRLRAYKNAIATKSHSVVNLATLDKSEANSQKNKGSCSSSSSSAVAVGGSVKSGRMRIQNSNTSSHDTLIPPRFSLQLPKGSSRKTQRASLSSGVNFSRNDVLRSSSGNPYHPKIMTSSVSENRPIHVGRRQSQGSIVTENSKNNPLRESQPYHSSHSTNLRSSNSHNHNSNVMDNSRENTLRKSSLSRSNHTIQNTEVSVKSSK
uniref:Protein kinase domain-containing protein n=2 Tax=Trichobilharzia regenti TaxID=157069 RepID=A0AA85J0P9_TRIRE|nr:unnamed protein product [Trichobilharzia regenti]